MDNNHARFILQSSASGTPDPDDPQIASALREAARDPELGAWLERERRFDDALRNRLCAVAPPRGLKAEVLSAAPLSLPEPSSRRWLPLAWAALLAVLATVAAVWLWPRGAVTEFAAFRSEMQNVASGRVRFSFSSGDARELERWLYERAAVGTVALPAGMKSLPGLGCRSLQWRGRPVGLICLKVGEGRALHVFAVARGAMRDVPAEGPAHFGASGGMQTAAWRQGDVVYFAALKGDVAELRQSLEPRSF